MNMIYYNFIRKPLFSNKKQFNSNNYDSNSSNTIPGTFVATLNKPIVMCLSTLNQLQSQIGNFKCYFQSKV